MKIPGPDHPIAIEKAKARWCARFAGQVIADTVEALILQEASYAPVVYFPRSDVNMEVMKRTERSTYCPYKGAAAYFAVASEGQVAENAVWTYEEPYPAMAQIEGRLAFYPHLIEIFEPSEEPVSPG